MIDEDFKCVTEYKDQQKHYDGHKFTDAPNFVKGHVPRLYVDNNRIKIRYLQCHVKSSTTKCFEAEANYISSYATKKT